MLWSVHKLLNAMTFVIIAKNSYKLTSPVPLSLVKLIIKIDAPCHKTGKHSCQPYYKANIEMGDGNL